MPQTVFTAFVSAYVISTIMFWRFCVSSGSLTVEREKYSSKYTQREQSPDIKLLPLISK